jgi:hypothetical protein
MRTDSDFNKVGFSTAATPSPFREGDRVQIPDGRWGTIILRDPETHKWRIKVHEQWAFEYVSDWDLRQANLRGKS